MNIKKFISKKLKKKLKNYFIKNISYEDFIAQKKNFIVKPLKTEIEKDEIHDENKSKIIICPFGSGHSGSGTIIDFLSEFNNCSVYGFHDPNGSLFYINNKTTRTRNYEIDFIRHAGGIFELEQAFAYRNIFVQDAAVKRYITLVEYFYKKFYKNKDSIYGATFLKETREFINSITEFQITSKEIAYQFEHMYSGFSEYSGLEEPFLKEPHKFYNIYYLKNLSIKEYREIARKYLEKFLGCITSKEYLILDAVLAEGSPDFSRKKDYIKNLKGIMVYRDPRDQYVTAHHVTVPSSDFINPWIPKDVEDFIKFYKRNTIEMLEIQDKDLLKIRFEDFVFDYEKTSKIIMDFLGLKNENHILVKQFFNPDVSVKNVGIYKNYENQQIINKLEKDLNEYCYKQ